MFDCSQICLEDTYDNLPRHRVISFYGISMDNRELDPSTVRKVGTVVIYVLLVTYLNLHNDYVFKILAGVFQSFNSIWEVDLLIRIVPKFYFIIKSRS